MHARVRINDKEYARMAFDALELDRSRDKNTTNDGIPECQLVVG